MFASFRFLAHRLLFRQDFFDTIDQMLGAERFGDIIVNLGNVQPKDFIDALGFCSEDNDRDMA